MSFLQASDSEHCGSSFGRTSHCGLARRSPNQLTHTILLCIPLFHFQSQPKLRRSPTPTPRPTGLSTPALSTSDPTSDKDKA